MASAAEQLNREDAAVPNGEPVRDGSAQAGGVRELPPLPLPTLRQTIARFVERSVVLSPQDRLEALGNGVADILAPGGLGERLQAGLEVKAETDPCWRCDQAEEDERLAAPGALPFSGGPGAGAVSVMFDPRLATGNPAQRAAEVTRRLADIYKAQQGGLGARLFSSVRVPGRAGDGIDAYGGVRHVVVFWKRRIYMFDILDGAGHPLDQADLEAQYRKILTARAPDGNPAPATAALTAAERGVWAEDRERLRLDPHNRMTLGMVEAALFHVSLETGDFEDHGALFGAPGTRWFDKTLSVAVDAAGRVAVRAEGAGVAPATWGPLLEGLAAPGLGEAEFADTDQPAPKRLHLTLDPWVFTALDAATDRLERRSRAMSHASIRIEGLGTARLAQSGFDAHALVLLALMRAEWTLTGRMAKAGTPVSLDAYRGGGSETVWLASAPILEAMRALDDGGCSPDARSAAIAAAATDIANRIKDAEFGKGVDGHLRALQRMATKQRVNDAPALLSHAVMERDWDLWCQPCPVQTAHMVTVPPPSETGIGVGYSLKRHGLTLSVTSFRGSGVDAAAFLTGVQTAFRALGVPPELIR